ncbi:MAG: adenylate/guanylate cyclase domain-containing protein [Pseudanabaena sp. ELA607]
MPYIHCLPDDQIIEASIRDTLLYASLSYGIPHASACGGMARCSTCRVRIVNGTENCQPRNALEQKLSEHLQLPADIRLACQTKVSGDVTLRRLVFDRGDIESVESQVQLGSIGEEKPLAVLFADIRNFTKMAEKMLPYDVIYLLNSYFKHMEQVIHEHGGVINNYMGDGLMALFNLEHPAKTAEMSTRAALMMLKTVELLNQHLDILTEHPLKIGIGIHYGTVVLGKISSNHGAISTAIGDTVNLASRIEAVNKSLGTSLLISAAIQELIAEQVIIKQEYTLPIAGKTGEYKLYEVTDIQYLAMNQIKTVTKEKGFLERWLRNWWL